LLYEDDLCLSPDSITNIAQIYNLSLHQRREKTDYYNLSRCNQALWDNYQVEIRNSFGFFKRENSEREKQCLAIEQFLKSYTCLSNLLRYFSRCDNVQYYNDQIKHFCKDVLTQLDNKKLLAYSIRTYQKSLPLFYTNSQYVRLLTNLVEYTIESSQQGLELLILFDGDHTLKKARELYGFVQPKKELLRAPAL
jgi:hypothetical protein